MEMMTAMPAAEDRSSAAAVDTCAGEFRPPRVCSECRCPVRPAEAHAGPTGEGDVSSRSLASLLERLEPFPEMDPATLARHARQYDVLVRDGYEHAAVTEARALLMALVVNVSLDLKCPGDAEAIAEVRLHKSYPTDFPVCNFSLYEMNFFSPTERTAVQRAYEIASDAVGRLGATNAAFCRLARSMAALAVEHLIERYTAWKAGCQCKPYGG